MKTAFRCRSSSHLHRRVLTSITFNEGHLDDLVALGSAANHLFRRLQHVSAPTDERHHADEEDRVTQRSGDQCVDEPHRRRRVEHDADEERPDDATGSAPDQQDGWHASCDRDSVGDPQHPRRECRRHRKTGQRRRRPDDRRPDVDEGEKQEVGGDGHREVDDHHRARPEERRQRNAQEAADEVESEKDGNQERRVMNWKIEILDGERRQERNENHFDPQVDVVEKENHDDECHVDEPVKVQKSHSITWEKRRKSGNILSSA